jgi:hypothetical protein
MGITESARRIVMAEEQYPDERLRADGTVEPDEADNSPPVPGRRTVDAGADAPAGPPSASPEE